MINGRMKKIAVTKRHTNGDRRSLGITPKLAYFWRRDGSLDFKFICESLGDLDFASGVRWVWVARAGFVSGVESTFYGRGRRCGARRCAR